MTPTAHRVRDSTRMRRADMLGGTDIGNDIGTDISAGGRRHPGSPQAPSTTTGRR
jgi:hypothetical protein